MTDSTLRQAIWLGLLNSSRLSRYYQSLADKHRRKRKIRDTLLLGTIASLAFASLVPVTDMAIFPAAALLVFSPALNAYFNYQPDLLDSVADDFGIVQMRYRNLFEESDAGLVDESAARQVHNLLSEQIESLGRRVNVSIDAELNEKATKDSDEIECGSYARA